MVRTLIVEDELLARAGLHSLIDWENLGFVLLEDAKDGKEALDRIREYHPEVMLLDINIPVITGLELLTILREDNIYVKTVVISCYDDFETVKKAMKLGAVDYIRKFGLTKEELTNVLSNITNNPLVRLNLEPEKSVAQSRREMREKLRNVPEGFETGSCLCLYMLWKYADEIADWKVVEVICRQFYQGLHKQISVRIFEGKLVLLVKNHAVKRQEAETLLKQIKHFISTDCYISITPYNTENIPDDFFIQLANTIEVIGFYDGSDYIVELTEPLTIQNVYPFDSGEYYGKIKKALSGMSGKEIIEVLDQLFVEIIKRRYLSVNLVKKLMIEILGGFSDKAALLGGAIEEVVIFGSYKHYQKLANITSFEDMKEWYLAFAEKFAEIFFTRQKKSDSDIMQSVLDYIERNMLSPIRLAEVARCAGVSEQYLSTFFKKHMGENLIPYINRKKIELSKKLLTEGHLVYQVSDMLGFENNTYFSKVFKKMEGITPEQYRKKRNGSHTDGSGF